MASRISLLPAAQIGKRLASFRPMELPGQAPNLNEPRISRMVADNTMHLSAALGVIRGKIRALNRWARGPWLEF